MDNPSKNNNPLSDEAKAQMLGSDPFAVVYKALYDLVSEKYAETGFVNHEIIGFEFHNGAIIKAHVLQVEEQHLENITNILEWMLQQFPVVSQVMEAWSSPPSLFAPSTHPERQEVVSIHIHTDEAYSVANCPVDPVKRVIGESPLYPVIKTEGKTAFKIKTRH